MNPTATDGATRLAGERPLRTGPGPEDSPGELSAEEAAANGRSDPRVSVWSEKFARRLPGWMGSIRFRLTATYSLFLFGLGAVVIASIYFLVADRLQEQTVSRSYVQVTAPGSSSNNTVLEPDIQNVERLANERALRLLGSYSLEAMGLMFFVSLGVGWLVAGRVLAPIGAITEVAREIQATDLKQRISLHGPPDELRQLADTFDDMVARLDEAFESQRRFIQEASHELRNPLAVIRTNLDVTLSDPDASAEELRRAGALVQRTAERMSRLVDDLLAYAQSGAPERQHANLDVADVIADAAAEFTVPAEARGLHLEASSPPGLWVMGDRIALRQALANLLANAVRVAPKGTRLRLAGGREDPWVWMAVEDEGPGIPEEDREQVFQRFWRGDGQTARADGRSGLGLTIVRQIAETHRGEVRLIPSDAGGSTFVIWLPASGRKMHSKSTATT